MKKELSPSSVALCHRYLVNPNDIILLVGDVNYTTVHLVDNKKHVLSYTLSKIEKQLNTQGNFMRLNRSQVVNKDYILKIIDNEVIMKNNVSLKISRRRRMLCTNYLK